jgi:hypothetical protein
MWTPTTTTKILAWGIDVFARMKSGFPRMEIPNGTIWTETKVDGMPHKASIKLGHQHTGTILGGTQAYTGVTGTYDLEVRKDGKHAVTVFHIVRGKK